MKGLGVFQTECVARMKTSRPAVSKALHGEVNITFASAVRFAKALRLDFFPQLVQPTTGGSAYLPSQVIDIFPQEEPQPISRNISIP